MKVLVVNVNTNEHMTTTIAAARPAGRVARVPRSWP